MRGNHKLAVRAARDAMPLVRATGDQLSMRYLLYTGGLSLVGLQRWDDAAESALSLLDLLCPEDDAWRAKALALLADVYVRHGQVPAAVDALAEACGLVGRRRPRSYLEFSAMTSVAISLGTAHLFEAAVELYQRALLSPAMRGEAGSALHGAAEIFREFAMAQLTQGIALEMDDRAEQGRQCHVAAAASALHMMRLTAGRDEQMHTRAAIIEAFAQLQLGEVALGRARLQDSVGRLGNQPDVPEFLVGQFGLALAAIAFGEHDDARTRLHIVAEGSTAVELVVWQLATLVRLVDVEVAARGDHPAVAFARRAERLVARHWWTERQNLFLAVQDRMHVRELTEHSARLGRDATVDPLTNLGNRRLLETELTSPDNAVALFVDVDRFKSVNDRFSHAVGDQVLCRMAAILRSQCRLQDVLVRFGGDEFVVLLREVPTGVAIGVGERIRDAVAQAPWHELADGLAVTVSVGVAVARTDSAPDVLTAARQVLADADAALYKAKRNGRDCVAIH
ncbi:MAG: GGDEF domain-containing protein [Angustibacter sp.]